MAGRLSLAQQIAQLDQPAPVDFDPEDVQLYDQEREDAQGGSTGGQEHYLDVGPSALRRLQDSISDPKYAGVRTSRKQLMEESDSESGSGEDEDEDEETSLARNDATKLSDPSDEEGQDDDAEGQSESEIEEDDASDEMETEHSPQLSSPTKTKAKTKESIRHSAETQNDSTNDVTSTLKKTREEDIKKGQAVKRQIALWDALLDSRIRLQKSVVAANKLPLPDKVESYLEQSECQEALSKLLHETVLLTEDLFDLQNDLSSVNDIISPPPRKRRRLSEDASVADFSAYLAEASEDVATMEESLHPYTVQTLSKWSSKIQAVAPSVLLPSNKGTFARGKQPLKSVNELIDETLSSHKDLVQRTRVVRGKKGRIGVAEPEQEVDDDAGDAEAFDDTDFYSKMLRDVIESRGNSTGGEDWLMLQKQKKAKKKVDTKASKGRKLRFEVHEKIQNFMVPVPVVGSWHEEQIDELFASLLGKGYETTVNEPSSEAPPPASHVPLAGLRIFG